METSKCVNLQREGKWSSDLRGSAEFPYIYNEAAKKKGAFKPPLLIFQWGSTHSLPSLLFLFLPAHMGQSIHSPMRFAAQASTASSNGRRLRIRRTEECEHSHFDLSPFQRDSYTAPMSISQLQSIKTWLTLPPIPSSFERISKLCLLQTVLGEIRSGFGQRTRTLLTLWCALSFTDEILFLNSP